MNRKILIIAIISVIIDQVSKMLASIYLKLNISKTIISKFFYLTYCHNEGAAWGILKDSRIIIIIGTLFSLILIYHFVYCFKNNFRNNLAFGLLYGGLAGNLIDRLAFGFVRDFLDFYIFKYDFPVFNIADICIVIGVFLLLIAMIKGEDVNENSSRSKSRKTRQVSSKLF